MILDVKQMQYLESQMLGEVSRICIKHNIPFFMAFGSCLGAIRHQGSIPWDSDIDITIFYDDLDRFVKIVSEEIDEHFYVYTETDYGHIVLFPRIGLRGVNPSVIHVDVFPLIGAYPSQKEQIKVFKKCNHLIKLFKYKNLDPKLKTKHFVKRVYFNFIKLCLLPITKKKIVNKYHRICRKYPIASSDKVMVLFDNNTLRNVIDKDVFGKGLMVRYDDFEVPIPSNYEYYLRNYYHNYMEYPAVSEQEYGLNKKYFISDEVIEKNDLLKKVGGE